MSSDLVAARIAKAIGLAKNTVIMVPGFVAGHSLVVTGVKNIRRKTEYDVVVSVKGMSQGQTNDMINCYFNASEHTVTIILNPDGSPAGTAEKPKAGKAATDLAAAMTAPAVPRQELDKMKVAELKKSCVARGLDATGLKKVLQARLAKHADDAAQRDEIKADMEKAARGEGSSSLVGDGTCGVRCAASGGRRAVGGGRRTAGGGRRGGRLGVPGGRPAAPSCHRSCSLLQHPHPSSASQFATVGRRNWRLGARCEDWRQGGGGRCA